jgi:creatinine amidohydrolase
MWHGDETETALGLYLYPQYVDMSKAVAGGGEPLVDGRFIMAPGQGSAPGKMRYYEGTFSRPEWKELENGVIGDATKATREKGEKLVTGLVDHVTELIDDIKQRYPIGTKPPVD